MLRIFDFQLKQLCRKSPTPTIFSTYCCTRLMLFFIVYKIHTIFVVNPKNTKTAEFTTLLELQCQVVTTWIGDCLQQ